MSGAQVAFQPQLGRDLAHGQDHVVHVLPQFDPKVFRRLRHFFAVHPRGESLVLPFLFHRARAQAAAPDVVADPAAGGRDLAADPGQPEAMNRFEESSTTRGGNQSYDRFSEEWPSGLRHLT